MIVRILTALALIPVVLALIFYAPLWLFLLVVEGFLVAALWEMAGILRRYGVRGYKVTYPLGFALPWVWCYANGAVLPLLVGGGLLLLAWSLAEASQLPINKRFLGAAANLTAVAYVGFPFAVACTYHPWARLAQEGRGPSFSRGHELVMVLVTIWASDAAAYFVGQAFGRHKVSPVLSPNKSLEGFVAAIVCAVLAPVIYGRFFLGFWPVPHLILVGLVVGSAGILGDLFESLIKRGAGIKDTSRLIPGHGGVLDRIDSLLFAFPAYYVLVELWMAVAGSVVPVLVE